MKVRCIHADAPHLEPLKVYTVADETEERYLINVFEDMEDYAPMYGSYEKWRFEIIA